LLRQAEERGLRRYAHKFFEGHANYYHLKEVEPIIDKINQIGQSLEGKAQKWHTHMDIGTDRSKVPPPNDDEVPTEEYLEAVELQR
jgi:hypothetical protein